MNDYDTAASDYRATRDRDSDRSLGVASPEVIANHVDVQVIDDAFTLTRTGTEGYSVESTTGLLPAGIPAAEFLRQQGVVVKDSSWEFAHLDRDSAGESVQGWRAVGTMTADWDTVRDRIGGRGRSRFAGADPVSAERISGERGRVDRADEVVEQRITRDENNAGVDADAVRAANALRAVAQGERAVEQTARAEVAFDREMTTNAYTGDDQSWRAEQAHDGERASAAQRRGTDRLNQADAAEGRAASTAAAPQAAAVRSVTVKASNRWIPSTPPGHEPARGRSQSRGR